MRKLIHRLLSGLLEPLGFSVNRLKEQKRFNTLQQILIDFHLHSGPAGAPEDGLNLTFIVFSKNRPLQLEGLLRSLFTHVNGAFQIHVLYSVESDEEESCYRELADEIGDRGQLFWHREANFRDDLVKIVENVKTPFVSFLVDDIIFIRPVDLKVLGAPALNTGILSLRLGQNVVFNYMNGRPQTPPQLKQCDTPPGMLGFSWKDSEGDWAYPASVDGNVFPVNLIRAAVGQLTFSAPNSFESALNILNPLLKQMRAYCHTESRLINIPLNCIQTEKKNRSASVSNDELLKLWTEGKRIDIEKMKDMPTEGVHQEIELPLR